MKIKQCEKIGDREKILELDIDSSNACDVDLAARYILTEIDMPPKILYPQEGTLECASEDG